MSRLSAGALLASFVIVAAPAFAQAPAAVRVAGVVTAVSPTSVTVKGTDGKATVVGVTKAVQVMTSRPINIESIKPGMYVATANTNIDANSGKSIELRMSPPAAKGQEFSRPMAQANTTMTNGTVQTVSKGAGGRELNVYVPGGMRKIIVPPDVKVIGNFMGTLKDVKVGDNVTANAAKTPAGDVVATRITIVKG
jgi:hypothetical protein